MPPRRPNVLLIVADDHAANAVGAYGSILTNTPNIDAIAAAGVRFDRCFAANSLCAPSRASILTGTHSHVNGVTTLRTPFDGRQPTFVSILHDAGYRTAVFGKWHLGDAPEHDPQAFDDWAVLIDQGDYRDPLFRTPRGEETHPGYTTDVVTDLALRWLDRQDGDSPWCLLVHHKAPHRPWQPDERHRERVERQYGVPRTFSDDLATRSASARHARMRIADDLTPEDLKHDAPPGLDDEALALWRLQRFLEDYLRCVASLDENVGRMRSAVEARGETDDTLVLYTSDQGLFLGEHGWFDKRFMYEESIRMPLVLSLPRVLRGGRVHDGLTSNVDLAQTILDAAGAPHDPRMQGRSAWPDLLGRADTPPARGLYYRYWEHDDPSHHVPAHYGWRTDRYKLLYFYNDGMGLPGTGDWAHEPEWELYDLEADPDEVRNVVDEPVHAAALATLKAELWREQARLGDAPHPSQPRPPGV